MRSAFRFLKWNCVAAVLMSMVTIGVQAQQIYRIVGSDGRVTFSDQPPPTAAPAATGPATPGRTKIPPETAPVANVAIRQPATLADGLPYSLRQIVLRYPLTLYTTKDCPPCASARDLLIRRGVPFTEKTISTAADSEALKKISGDTSLPFATIGSQYLRGFSEMEWTDYLKVAGYPTESELPSGYQRPAPESLVTLQKVAPSSPAKSESEERRSRGVNAGTAREEAQVPAARSTPANPSGIQF
jgi:glutaredoxin